MPDELKGETLVAYVVFGGMGSLPGAIAGAALLTWLPEFLKDQVPAADRQMWIGAVVLLMMIFFFFGWFSTATWLPNQYGPLAGVVLALTLYNGSVIAELVRSGVYSLPKGQSEAGLSIGLTPGQTLRSIELPQALRSMLPETAPVGMP